MVFLVSTSSTSVSKIFSFFKVVLKCLLITCVLDFWSTDCYICCHIKSGLEIIEFQDLDKHLNWRRDLGRNLEKIWTITSFGIYSDILLGMKLKIFLLLLTFYCLMERSGGGGRALERETIVGCGHVFKVSMVKRTSKVSCDDKRSKEALFIQGQ